MIEIDKCSECGGKLECKIEGRIQGLFCNQCNQWGIVTTYIPKIDLDITKYKIYLRSADSKNINHIKALATVGNINFLQARQIAEEDKPLIFEGEAVEVDKIRNIFHDLSIKYDIEPDFPY